LKDNAETISTDNPQELLKIPGVNRVVRLAG
jgi:hypothetical protein